MRRWLRRDVTRRRLKAESAPRPRCCSSKGRFTATTRPIFTTRSLVTRFVFIGCSETRTVRARLLLCLCMFSWLYAARFSYAFLLFILLFVPLLYSLLLTLLRVCYVLFDKYSILKLHVLLQCGHSRWVTIQDAIFTCARKPIWVRLVYRTEPTSKYRKSEKLKNTNGYGQK